MARPTQATIKVAHVVVAAAAALIAWLLHRALDAPLARLMATNGVQF